MTIYSIWISILMPLLLLWGNIQAQGAKLDPCDDFYSYACGNFAEEHVSKYYQEMTGFMEYQYNSYVLENIYQDIESELWFGLHSYWRACNSETSRNLTKYLEDIKPGPQLDWPIWPTTTAYKIKFRENFNVWTLLGKLQSFGLNNILINQEILVDEKGKYGIMLEPAYSENNTTLPPMAEQHVFLMLMGVKTPRTLVRKLMVTNKWLLKIMQEYEDYRDEKVLLTYAELKKLLPELSLYLEEFLFQGLLPDTLITLRNFRYFEILKNKVRLTFKPEDLCNYVMMKFIYYLVKDGATDFNPMDCVKDLRNKMDLAVNYYYFRYKYNPKAGEYNGNITAIFGNIKTTYTNLLLSNHLNLTSCQTKTLLRKIQHLRLNIGNLPENIKYDKVLEFYKNVTPLITKDNYYKNQLLLLKHRFLKSLHNPATQTFFIVKDNNVGSSSVPFYVTQQNMIILPFGSLNAPLYDVNFSDYQKYSLLGFILAHEATHALDVTGLYFNHLGGKLSSYSKILDNDNFVNSLECLESQLETDNINERMADIVGIRIVEQLFASKYPIQLNSYTKSFYLNLAQLFCGKSDIEFLDHDSDADRLNQIVINSEKFAKAFKCAVGRKMNPGKKCRLY